MCDATLTGCSVLQILYHPSILKGIIKTNLLFYSETSMRNSSYKGWWLFWRVQYGK